jgi:phosphate transport system permease protein
MASDQSTTGAAQSFGTVSRRVGTIFRYGLLAATLSGIVVLGFLLVFVVNDAFQPLTADPGWHAVYLGGFLLPTLAVGAWLHRRSTIAFSTGLLGVFVPAVSLLYAGGIAALFIDVIPTLVWLSFAIALAIPVVVFVALRYGPVDLPFAARLGTMLVVTVGSLLFVPNVVQFSVPIIPTEWLTMALTLGVPEALLVWFYARSRWTDRTATVAGVGTFLAIVGSAFVSPALVGVGPIARIVVTAVSLVPSALIVGTIVADRPEARPGLALPVVAVGGLLLASVAVDALGFAGPNSWVDWSFLTSTIQSGNPRDVGIYAGIVGTILLMFFVAALSFPIGVGAAIYLEEYAPDTTFTRIIDVNINNLAGVPSVVYGLLGLGLFIRYGGFQTGTLAVAGATLSLLILPIIIISSREAIRSVPSSLRQASYGMGATRWQTVREVVLPRAFPGILTGTILGLSRAIGETAPLLVIGAAQVFGVPSGWNDTIGAMPLQLYVWASTYASPAFYTTVLAAGIVVLLSAMLTMNSIAIVLRNKYQQE